MWCMRYRNLCSIFLWVAPAALQTPCGSALLSLEIGCGEFYISYTVNLQINFVCNIVYFSWFLDGVIATQLNC